MVKTDEQQKSETILVMDDDPIVVRMIENILRREGYSVSLAEDVHRFTEICIETNPTLVLLDIRMPEISGISICQSIRKHPDLKEMPVIFITGATDDETLKEAFDAGATDYVKKPISSIEMMARIKSAITHMKASKKLQEEKKLEAVLETAGGVCHELNQPLQYVLGATQLLMMDMSKDNPIYASLEMIRKQADRMGTITRKLMDITHYKTRTYVSGRMIIDIDHSCGKK